MLPMGYVKAFTKDTSTAPGAANHDNTSNGRAAIAEGANSVVITNNIVTADSQIFVTLLSADSRLKSVAVTPALGSFTLTGNDNAKAATKFAYKIE